MNHAQLSQHFRVTAFVDVLGWGSLTDGIDSLTLRKMKRSDSLTESERELAEVLTRKVQLAHRLDAAVVKILHDLEAFGEPTRDVLGEPGAKHFWENRHVTFVRSSDNIFLHSASFKGVVAVVTELLKRGLDQGLLFRAGLSCGVVLHIDHAASPRLDPRSRDISLFGDGITTAVSTEKAGSGCGVHAFIHNRLMSLLRDEHLLITRPHSTSTPEVQDELCWWKDLAAHWPDTESIGACIPPTKAWFDSAASRLLTHDDFAWNRASTSGRLRVDDTLEIVRAASAELEAETEAT